LLKKNKHLFLHLPGEGGKKKSKACFIIRITVKTVEKGGGTILILPSIRKNPDLTTRHTEQKKGEKAKSDYRFG